MMDPSHILGMTNAGNDKLFFGLSIYGSVIGLAYLSFVVYLMFKHPEEVERNALGRWMGLHRASGWDWVQCLAGGVGVSCLSLMFVLLRLGGGAEASPGWLSEGVQFALFYITLASFLVAFIAKFMVWLTKG